MQIRIVMDIKNIRWSVWIPTIILLCIGILFTTSWWSSENLFEVGQQGFPIVILIVFGFIYWILINVLDCGTMIKILLAILLLVISILTKFGVDILFGKGFYIVFGSLVLIICYGVWGYIIYRFIYSIQND